MAPKTTWEEMARLGWLRQQVFVKLNAQRGGTMVGGAQNDMALNTGFAEDWRWVATDYMVFPVANVETVGIAITLSRVIRAAIPLRSARPTRKRRYGNIRTRLIESSPTPGPKAGQSLARRPSVSPSHVRFPISWPEN
jgi:hypothetical protein